MAKILKNKKISTTWFSLLDYLKSFFLNFSAFLLGMIWVFLWMAILSGFRGIFPYPWGSDAGPLDPRLLGLIIYNAIEFLFTALFFLGAVWIYRFFIVKACSNVKSAHINTFFLLLSWTCFSLISYGLANFFCCPGLFPKVFNKFYWLTLPEFSLFYLLGQFYLLDFNYKIR